MEEKINISLYYKCQLIGWTVASLYWSFQGWNNGGFRTDLALTQFISDLILYIFLTDLYRIFAIRNHWQDLVLNQLIWRIIMTIPIMAIFYTLVTASKLYLIRRLFSSPSAVSFSEFFATNGDQIFIAGIRLMAIWLLAYHLYHYARREIRLSAENARLELNFKQSQLDNLYAQINPHFLFNALNTIKSLVYANPSSAGRGIDLLSELLRSGLYKGDAMMISLNEELDLVRDYLELEQLRMQERLNYEINFDPLLSGVLIPRLSIQTLVENGVKHGVSLLKDGGKIFVSVAEQSGLLHIQVLNPGKLSYDNSSGGIGLRNLRERLDIAYDNYATFSIAEVENYVQAEIKIPMK